MQKNIKKIVYLALMLVMVGCGYKPSVKYVKKVLGNKIYAEVTISRRDPKNAVYIQDAINEAIVTRFGGRIASKESADTHIKAFMKDLSFASIAYNENGYVTSQKAKLTLYITYSKNEFGAKKRSMTVTGEYDFEKDPHSTLSESKRLEAIKQASIEALDEFIAKVAIDGLLDEQEEKKYAKEEKKL